MGENLKVTKTLLTMNSYEMLSDISFFFSGPIGGPKRLQGT